MADENDPLVGDFQWDEVAQRHQANGLNPAIVAAVLARVPKRFLTVIGEPGLT
jgi:hypothetical protein